MTARNDGHASSLLRHPPHQKAGGPPRGAIVDACRSYQVAVGKARQEAECRDVQTVKIVNRVVHARIFQSLERHRIKAMSGTGAKLSGQEGRLHFLGKDTLDRCMTQRAKFLEALAQVLGGRPGKLGQQDLQAPRFLARPGRDSLFNGGLCLLDALTGLFTDSLPRIQHPVHGGCADARSSGDFHDSGTLGRDGDDFHET